jgi:hypothetical protein
VAGSGLRPSVDAESLGGSSSSAATEEGVCISATIRTDVRLAVSVSYTETKIGSDSQAASGRVRTFRKLYQFVAQPTIFCNDSPILRPSVDAESLGGSSSSAATEEGVCISVL